MINDFAVQRADGADLAVRFYQLVAVAGPTPDGGTNRMEIAVCSIPALLAMKGHALAGRYKQKDAYDIYYCVRNYPGGIEVLAQEYCLLLGHFRHIADKFDTFEGYGPTCVRRFVEDTHALCDRTPEQWQQDAFGQIDALLRAMALRG